MLEGKYIIASGPVIIENGKLLVNKDDKDDFYKLPGGTVEKGDKLIEACHREVKEENNGEIEIIRPLNPMIIHKNPQTKEFMTIVLIHYLAKLLNREELKPIEPESAVEEAEGMLLSVKEKPTARKLIKEKPKKLMKKPKLLKPKKKPVKKSKRKSFMGILMGPPEEEE